MDDLIPAPRDFGWIDVEHGQVLHCAHVLPAAATERRAERVRVALGLLARAVRKHFADEEAWMAARGHETVSGHARQHAEILTRYVAARGEVRDARGARVNAVTALARAVETHLRTARPAAYIARPPSTSTQRPEK